MGTGAEIGIALALGAASAGAGYAGASAQNSAAQKSAAAANKATETKIKQINDAAALERRKATQETARIRARARVAAAASGSEWGGSWEAIDLQAIQDLNSNLNIISTNERNQINNVISGNQADLASLEARTSNPILAGFMGGMQGAATGLSIVSGIKDLNTTKSGSTLTTNTTD